MPVTTKPHFSRHDLYTMTGQDLLDELGIKSTGVRRSFVANGGDDCTAWMTMGRGKQHGRFYVHIIWRMDDVPVVDNEGRFTGVSIEDKMHFRGRPLQTIGTYKQA